MSIQALTKLVTSSKASVLLAVVIALLVLLQLGDITAVQFLATIKIIVPSWMLAHAAESGAKALANSKLPPAEVDVELDSEEDG
ncbi:MAG: hypothetical protein JRD89_10770 [Deltaproteobacteria bacterium]|nr:hypothetical protein [Deltaproteobacteria bacterium]